MRFAPAVVLGLAATAVAQDPRTVIDITPEGIFPRTAYAPSTMPQVNPNPSTPGLRWTYANPPGTPWITASVSTGHHGSLAWLGQDLNGERLSLLATTEDGSPPVPVWEFLLGNISGLQVHAADKAPTAVMSVLSTTAPTHVVNYMSAFQNTPVWSATINVSPNGSPLHTRISDNGRWVAAGHNDPANVASVAIFDAASGTPNVPVMTAQASSHQLRNMDLSGNGRMLLLATHTQDHIIDLTTNTQVFQAATVSHDAHAIDFDGDNFVRGGFDVGIWQKQGTTYQRLVAFNDTSLGFGVYTAADISNDGRTAVVAGYDANNNANMRIYCWDIQTGSASLLWTFTSNGTGTFQDVPQAVSISDNGEWITVGTWGDAGNTHPESMLFRKGGGNTPVQVVDSPGSAYDVDLSGDGQFWLTGTKAVHANTFGNGGEGYCFDRGGQGHYLKGTPRIGNTITLNTGGNPGEALFLMIGTAKLPTPIVIGGIQGALEIDFGSPSIGPLLLGPIPPSGTHVFTFPIPNNPSWVGVTLFTQTVRAGSAVEFDNSVPLPFLP